MVLVKTDEQQMESSSATREHNERTVYLGDLDIETSERQIGQFFESINIPTAKIVKQAHSSYAHVTFQNADVARGFLEMAIVRINGRIIRVMPFNQPNNFDPEANLIIKNLEGYLNESDIIQKFKNFGEILSCKLVRDEKGESKCYAYLQYKDRLSASSAIDNLNNTYWDERCDPDFKYRKFQERLFSLKRGKLNESGMEEITLFNDYANKMGKKIYVGIFKKRNEYSKIKEGKEGKLSNLYVKNFGVNFGDRDLFNLFKTYGSIKSAKVRRLKVGLVEKPLGCGFVDFENPDEAEKARQALDGFVLSTGRKISVTYADCKSRRLRKKLEEIGGHGHGMLLTSGSTSSNESFDERAEESASPVFIDLSVDSNDHDLDRSRKISLSSESSHYSLASSSSSFAADVWSNTWSRLLNTSDWNEYRLFDTTSNSLF